MDADGSNIERVTIHPGEDKAYSWSPDSIMLAVEFYESYPDIVEVYVIDVTSKATTYLTNNSAQDLGPSWSSDGIKVIFTSGRDGNSEVYSVNADGTSLTNLTNNAAYDLTGNQPVWK